MAESIPPSPMTQLAAGAVSQHELFMAWVDAGFTRAEALQLLTGLIGAGAVLAGTRPPEEGQ